MNSELGSIPRLLVMCTVATGFDAVAEVLRHGFEVEAIVGVHPSVVSKDDISGFADVSVFAAKWGLRHLYVQSYNLKNSEDRMRLSELSFDLIWINGWQRLIPQWLIEMAALGAVGGHGSPDGIQRGRGRSPQNWAIMLGCKRFDLALFRVTPGVDDGPIVLERSFYYNDFDDIGISYKKASLCMAEMMIELLQNPALLQQARPQCGEAYYFPQRRPEDGIADWRLTVEEVWAHCRALTSPYPGLRTRTERGSEIIIWECFPFDDRVDKEPGTISFVFEDGTFLVTCSDGRILITDYSMQENSEAIRSGQRLVSQNFAVTLKKIVDRHYARYSTKLVSPRIMTKTEKG